MTGSHEVRGSIPLGSTKSYSAVLPLLSNLSVPDCCTRAKWYNAYISSAFGVHALLGTVSRTFFAGGYSNPRRTRRIDSAPIAIEP